MNAELINARETLEAAVAKCEAHPNVENGHDVCWLSRELSDVFDRLAVCGPFRSEQAAEALLSAQLLDRALTALNRIPVAVDSKIAQRLAAYRESVADRKEALLILANEGVARYREKILLGALEALTHSRERHAAVVVSSGGKSRMALA